MYGEYLKEILGKEILQTKTGFLTYSFTQDYVYLEDCYVLPDFRRTNQASNMISQIEIIARSRGLKKMIGGVCPTTNGSTVSLKVFLNNGFKLDSSAVNYVLLKKELV